MRMYSPRVPLQGLLVAAAVLLAGCGGGSGSADAPSLGTPVGLSVSYGVKGYQFSWNATTGATRYELTEDPDGGSGPQPEALIGGNTLTTTTYAHSLAGQLLVERVNASYRVRACDANGCGSYSAAITPDLTQAIGYFKAGSNRSYGEFGSTVVLSADGRTLAVGAPRDRSKATGINGDSSDVSIYIAGAVYVFSRSAATGTWNQQAYIKASNTRQLTHPGHVLVGSYFGESLALSSDGNTLAVGAWGESSNARGVNGDQSNNDSLGAGAVYVFTRKDSTWSQQAYVKATNTPAQAPLTSKSQAFGASVALSASGNLLAVGAPGEGSNATGVNGNQADTSRPGAGAVYTYVRNNDTWVHQAYLKADQAPAPTAVGLSFGRSLALSADGAMLAVGAPGEGVPSSNPQEDALAFSGAVYVFTVSNGGWNQQAVLKDSGASRYALLGSSVALSVDGNTLAARGEAADFIPLFVRSGGAWSQQARIAAKSSSIALSADGNTLIVGWIDDSSNATGINGNQADNSAQNAGAVRLYQRSATTWSPRTYIKASNAEWADRFGSSVALSGDGKTLAVGATHERSNATGVQGDQADNSGPPDQGAWARIANYGAVYLY